MQLIRVNTITITAGPHIADPTDVAPLVVTCDDGTTIFLASLRRMWWRRFLIWAIRRNLRKFLEPKS